MENPLVAGHSKKLKDQDAGVRQMAAYALGEIADPTAVPSLIEAVKDQVASVRQMAVEALGRIGNPIAVPSLIEAVKDQDWLVRQSAAEALGNIGNSDTLPRKILASGRLTPQQRIDTLASLRRARNLGYKIPDTRALCHAALAETDAAAREGAQTVLNWLNGDRNLLRGSQQNRTNQPQELLRASEGGTSETRPDTLGRAADKPERPVVAHRERRTLMQQIFRKR